MEKEPILENRSKVSFAARISMAKIDEVSYGFQDVQQVMDDSYTLDWSGHVIYVIVQGLIWFIFYRIKQQRAGQKELHEWKRSKFWKTDLR